MLRTIIVSFLIAASGGTWLDVPLKNWNVAGAAVPAAPKPQSDAELRRRCGEQGRPPSSAADRALVAQGWTLYGPLQTWGDASLILAGSDVDGMCRPLGYQGFVFVGDVLAGTIAPTPMDSRSDGAESEAMLTGSRAVYAEFARYGDKDPLCCPSRQSTVTYVIEDAAGKPLLVPQSAFTQPTGTSS
ncbi:MAG: LppP/LprE family lipoprotein [Deltaproteobacteria bacterium]|nr:LppP/LprE family lipoprotein [Deltaproteobacteria bacterium]